MTHFDLALCECRGSSGERRRQVVRIMDAALDAADPAQAVRAHLQREGDVLRVDGQDYALARYRRVIVVGAGKAGAPMAQAVEQVLGDRIAAGAVSVKYGYTTPTSVVRLWEAGHPVPDEAGRLAALHIVDLLREATADDLVLCLISGGGSALMTLPVEPITLGEMQQITDAMLRAGASINELNAVRKHLEVLKGGGLARLAYPAQVISLMLSDVVGNPLDVIASGPTVPDTSTFRDAYEVLGRYSLLDSAPLAIRQRLEEGLRGGAAETLKPGDPILERVQNVIVASNDIAARAAVRQAQALGLNSLLLSTYIEGEAREVAKVLVGIAREMRASGSPVAPPACLVIGGETTVTVRGDGRGGRNQEMALMAAMRLQGVQNVIVACLATDGSDGPTDAAGALAEDDTIARARALGLDAWDYLQRNDSYHFFSALGDLLLTGPTNTNVNDLAFVLVW